VDVDAEYRTLVGANPQGTAEPRSLPGVATSSIEEVAMGRGILLWLLGVPIPVIILLWLFFGH
jgi:hypothetical protein